MTVAPHPTTATGLAGWKHEVSVPVTVVPSHAEQQRNNGKHHTPQGSHDPIDRFHPIPTPGLARTRSDTHTLDKKKNAHARVRVCVCVCVSQRRLSFMTSLTLACFKTQNPVSISGVNKNPVSIYDSTEIHELLQYLWRK